VTRSAHLLWISDGPETPSGFGNVTRFVCDGLARRGHRVDILGWQTTTAREWNGCRVLPTGHDPWGSDAVFSYLIRHRPDAVIALGDVWWLPFFAAPHVRRQLELTGTPWVLYFPIDGETEDGLLPPSWAELLREVDVPIAMSRYGREVAERCGIVCELIPHGVDLETFAPPADRARAKAAAGFGDSFVILSDSRNQPRKLLPRLLDVFARFAADRPDALLHLHTDPDDDFANTYGYSYDVRADVRHLGLEERVRFTPDFEMREGAGLPLDRLAAYYQAADVHLLASSGEGFGLPTLQAAASGAVPMAGAYSASRELVEGHGEPIAIAEYGTTEFGIQRAMIDVDDAVARLVRLYDDRDELRRGSERSRAFALDYGWDLIVDQWDALARSLVPSRTRGAPAWAQRDRGERVIEQQLAASPGASITVRMVERELGRLEAAITADMRGASDVRLPTLPPPLEVAGVRVERRPCHLCVAPADVLVFVALQRIFPRLSGWIPSADAATDDDDVLTRIACDGAESIRLEVAQSVLVLNVSGGVPEEALVDAAHFGVPCIGTGSAAAQATLWPELAVDDPAAAVGLARALLTNSAWARRLAKDARRACELAYAPSEAEAAASLRRLNVEQRGALAGGGV
jgi:glycosyltransferase involved in cell wall biosynthesis